MSANKSSLEVTAMRNAVAHYQRAALMLSHAETLDSLRRAQAAFSQSGCRAAAARCVQLQRQIEAGGTDELPPVGELLRL
jgi:hypothetical protein